MLRLIKRFKREEAGAVTVDWVVLTAAIVGISLGLIGLLQNALTDKSEGIGTYVEDRTDLLD
ncbi:MAG: hypothetical protein HKN63_08010 [Rhodobacteraceae bacterium]|nr:hypothetical protein [Paracoccaceae bacterium]